MNRKMNNSQNSIKEKFRRYFLHVKPQEKKEVIMEVLPQQTTYSPFKYIPKKEEVLESNKPPVLIRAAKALEITNPFKGV